MEGCSSMSPWTNLYQQSGLARSYSLFTDPIQELQQYHDKLCNSFPSTTPLFSNIINNNNNNIVENRTTVDALKGGATSSVDQSLECLLSATNSNTDDTSIEDDGISMLFTPSTCKNMWNFSSCNNNYSTTQLTNKNVALTTNDQPTNPPKKRTKNKQDFNEGTLKRQKCDQNNVKTSQSEVRFSYSTSNNISFQQGSSSTSSIDEPDAEAIQQMKEMIYRAAAFRPVSFGIEPVEKPKRKNVRISSDPQTVAARQRRERISERLRVLQKLVPGGGKMDTASMLDEAANYLKFLRNQVKSLEAFGNKLDPSLHNYTTNNPTNNSNFHYIPSTINFQFSPMPFTMQTSAINTPQFSMQKP